MMMIFVVAAKRFLQPQRTDRFHPGTSPARQAAPIPGCTFPAPSPSIFIHARWPSRRPNRPAHSSHCQKSPFSLQPAFRSGGAGSSARSIPKGLLGMDGRGSRQKVFTPSRDTILVPGERRRRRPRVPKQQGRNIAALVSSKVTCA
jgi:hypothetical protein